MKIIDLLNKIANEEEIPKKIKYKNAIYTLRDDKDDYTSGDIWFTDSYDYLELNDEVEIIEEDKKIEKLNNEIFEEPFAVINKINEIIDYLEDKQC